jgi:hypothetical protein
MVCTSIIGSRHFSSRESFRGYSCNGRVPFPMEAGRGQGRRVISWTLCLGKPSLYRVRVARNSPSRIHVLPSVSKASPSQWNESGVISVNVQRVGVPSGRVPI